MQTNNSKEKVRQLQNKLYLTAKKCDSRRFHALYDEGISLRRGPTLSLTLSRETERERVGPRRSDIPYRKVHEIFGYHISWLSDIVCFEVVELFPWSC